MAGVVPSVVLGVEFSRQGSKQASKQASKQGSPRPSPNNQPASEARNDKLVVVEMNRQVLHRLPQLLHWSTLHLSDGDHTPSPKPPPLLYLHLSTLVRPHSPSLTLSSYRSHDSLTILHLPPKRLRSSCSQIHHESSNVVPRIIPQSQSALPTTSYTCMDL